MNNINCYFGVISKIIDPDLYTVEVEIPEENTELKAFPLRGEVDEPRVGDAVFLREIDPLYHSYYLYEKIKENNFIGIRSRGKVIKITQDDITIGIFDPSDESWYDDNSGADPTPESTSWIKIDSSGNIDINAEGDQKINITGNSETTIGGDNKLSVSGNCDITVSGNTKIESSGNCDIKAGGSCTINSPDVKITGGQLTTNGSVAPSSGPFNCLTNCVFSGAPHQGNIVSGT
jgi:hypothetical protein